MLSKPPDATNWDPNLLEDILIQTTVDFLCFVFFISFFFFNTIDFTVLPALNHCNIR